MDKYLCYKDVKMTYINQTNYDSPFQIIETGVSENSTLNTNSKDFSSELNYTDSMNLQAYNSNFFVSAKFVEPTNNLLFTITNNKNSSKTYLNSSNTYVKATGNRYVKGLGAQLSGTNDLILTSDGNTDVIEKTIFTCFRTN